MENNKIGCRAGKTKLVDPNMFDGQSSSNNISVPLEDLNISVTLKTMKKGRTVLTASDGKGSSENSNTLKVNFIEGNDINGTKVLTTNYTDLTTIFDDNSTENTQSLGITSIDIDFNASLTPMINITFIDVKGSAIFQNEGNISGSKSKNKYATFFQLPYPMFELTIKGYYGRPVKYCLHMLKFNSKFNAQTGNFEITCNFVGYNYAMLSDLLIGYLKAIPYTKIGKSRYDLINSERASNGLGPISTLDDLMKSIAKINDGLKKIGEKDANSKVLVNNEDKLAILDVLENTLTLLGRSLDIRHENNDGKFLFVLKDTGVKNQKLVIDRYISDIKKTLEKFNENTSITLTQDKFTKLDDLTYNGLSKKLLSATDSASIEELKLKIRNVSGDMLGKKIKDINDFINTLTIADTYVFDLINLETLYLYVDETRNTINNNTKQAKEQLALTIRGNIKETIGFEPSVRNIIEIFTTASEVFMESLYTVSTKAEALSNTKRISQLSQKFKEIKNSDIPQPQLNDKKYYPWPAYRESNDSEGFVDKYLGETGVLTNPKDVDELLFIDDLLEAFLKSQKTTDEAEDIVNNTEGNWFPINPIDTRLFDIVDTPYRRVGKNGLSDYSVVANLMLLRGMTFLGYNNIYLTTEEIESMAEIEANSIFKNVLDEKIKQGLGIIDLDYITNLKGEINDERNNIITLTSSNDYYYTYFPKSTSLEGFKILPINDGFSGNWGQDNQQIWGHDNTDVKFLTNYNNNVSQNKPLDGGVYVKMIPKLMFDKYSTLTLDDKPESVNITKNMLVLEKLKGASFNNSQDVRNAGFNVFGGVYGIQEMVNLDYGNVKYNNLPLKYVFYKQSKDTSDEMEKGVGLARKPNRDASFIYDLDTYTIPNTLEVVKNSGKTAYFDESLTNSFTPFIGAIDTVFKDVGKNWDNLSPIDYSELTYPFVEGTYTTLNKTYTFSLFGSRWYYSQSLSSTPLYSKALLFLSTLPWNGMPFEKVEIKRLFNTRAGFVHVPRLWAAYVGGLIWRMDKKAPIYDSTNSNIIVGGGSGNNDPIIFKKSINDVTSPFKGDETTFVAPRRNQSLHLLNGRALDNSDYIDLPSIIDNLPQQVKDEFKKIFFNFVNLNSVDIGENDDVYDFNMLNKSVQLVSDGDINTFDSKLAILIPHIPKKTSVTTIFYFPTSVLTDNFINIDKYQSMIPLSDDNFFEQNTSPYNNKGQINLMFKDVADNSSINNPVKMIVDMFTKDEIIVANTGYNIWNVPVNTQDTYYPIYCSKTNFEIYFKKVLSVFQEKNTSTKNNSERKQQEQELFGSSDENVIKLQLYKTCKNIYDKWLGDVHNINNVIFQCGQGERNSLDIELAKKYRPGTQTTKFIDSFRFVNRSYTDIGDKLFINPTPVNEYLIHNPNSSFYDSVSSLLSSNNFDFIPLPSFINYNDDKVLSDIFEPIGSYEEAISGGTCGPAFVCVYVGETSSHLDLADSDYPNDGLDFKCIDGNLNNIPKDFGQNSKPYENDVAVFAVNFGQQNQNIFKDITLDQSEFAETAESLQITDAISKKGSDNNATLAGQNIYNVYTVRSYKAEVEMMGNAMIQPMMHFQLNNIPMFHGAYLITRVKHSIKPNNMSTNFTGVRIRYPETKLLDVSELYMSLIDSIDLSNTSKGTSNTPTGGSFPPIVSVIYQNGGQNGNIVIEPNITTSKILVPSLILNKVDKDEQFMLKETVQPLNAMLKDWAEWMEGDGFSGNDGKYGEVISAFRGIEKQRRLKQQAIASGNGKTAATPGRSNHGWGIAVDLKFYKKNGTPIENYSNGSPNVKEGFNLTINRGLWWLLHNSYKYGFIIPESLRSGGSVEEFWHFEYHGKTAKCLLEQNPIIKGERIDTKINYGSDNDGYHPSVKNPKPYDNDESIYKSCKYTPQSYLDGSDETSIGGNADFWSLVTICAAENVITNKQGMADVAQSVYNRLATPNKPYGKTIKEIIVAKNQYEPTFNNVSDWKNISNLNTAIIALKNSKNLTPKKAKDYLEITKKAVTDVVLQNNAKIFIGTRTEFLARKPTSSEAIGIIERLPNDVNNVFFWRYAGKAIAELTPPNPPDFSEFA